MDEIKNIDVSFSEAIRNSDLKEVTIDFAENFMDSIMNEGLVKEIPIIGTLIGVGNLAISLKDRLFLKKILHFLSGINHISIEQRQNLIDEINESHKEKVKVGEKLIYILDKCDDHITAKYIAQLFCAFIDKRISYSDFLKGSRIIQNLLLADLEYFLRANKSEFHFTARAEEIPHEDLLPLINVGICGFGFNDSRLENVGFGEKEISGGEGVVWTTGIGEKLKEILRIEN